MFWDVKFRVRPIGVNVPAKTVIAANKEEAEVRAKELFPMYRTFHIIKEK